MASRSGPPPRLRLRGFSHAFLASIRRRVGPAWPLTVPLLLAMSAACTDATFAANQAANALFATGQYQQALEEYRALQEQRPDLPQISVNAGNALHMQKEYSRSINDYVEAQAAELDPVRSAAHYNRGNSLFRLDRLDEAREAYKETLRIDPNDRDAKFNIEVVDRIQEQRRQQEQQQQQQQPQPEPGSDNPAQQRPQGSTPGDENAGQDPGQNIEGNPGQQGNQPGPNPGAPDTGQQPGQNQGQQPQQGNPQGNQQQQPPPSQNPQLGQQPQPGQQAPGGQQNQQPGGQTPPPSVGEALPQFRQNLSPEEGLRLLDALRNEQRGLQGLIEGLPRNQIPRTRTPQPQDPLY